MSLLNKKHIQYVIVLALVIAATLVVIDGRIFRTDGPVPARVIAERDLSLLSDALDRFNVDVGRYPTSLEGLQALVDKGSETNNWNGPYVRYAPSDPWGGPYYYASPGLHPPRKFDLSSAGPDGKFGTADDIVN